MTTVYEAEVNHATFSCSSECQAFTEVLSLYTAFLMAATEFVRSGLTTELEQFL